MKQKEIEFLLNVAKLTAQQSTAVRLKVGGVVTDYVGNIIATGYNGTIRGGDNVCEYEDENGILVTKDSVIHAEQNLIAHAARRGISINKGIVFVTHSPCVRCTALMIQSGIEKVYFLEKYRSFDETFKEFGHMISMNMV